MVWWRFSRCNRSHALGAAASGDIERCQAVRGYAYNGWDEGSNTAAMIGHVNVLE